VRFDADFYQRRLARQLTIDDGDAGLQSATPAAALSSEAAVLALVDDSDFVRQAYRFFLRRDPDLDGLRYFCDMAKQQGRLTVIAELKNSEEAQRIAHGTPAAPPGSEPAPASVEVPWTDPALTDTSPELAGLMDIADDETFVTACYRRTLGRDPDPDGWSHHLSRLRAGEPRGAILHGFAGSDEARARGIAFTWQGSLLPGSGFRARARALLARVLPGAGHRRALADLRLSHGRFARTLHEISAGRQQLERMIQALSAAATQRAHDTSAGSTSLSSQMAVEIQRSREAYRALHVALDSLTTRVEAGLARGARTSVTAGDNVVASEVEGFIVGVPGEEWRLAAYHAFRGVLEPGLTRRFRETLRPGMVVVDVGANVGMYTLIAARLVGQAGRVISFEPTPRTFAILKDNIQVNGLLETGRVEFHAVAIADRIGTARFGVYTANNGHNTLFPAGGDAKVIDVATTTLDAALADVPRVDVIKIDAEGAEPLIWAGMSATLARNPGIRIFVEFAPALLERGGRDPAGFLAQIQGDGFHVHLVDDVTGAIRTGTHAQLRAVGSANLMLTRSSR
jgi:FkbM family methyltransferase